jgi:hypothetical protein
MKLGDEEGEGGGPNLENQHWQMNVIHVLRESIQAIFPYSGRLISLQ